MVGAVLQLSFIFCPLRALVVVACAIGQEFGAGASIPLVVGSCETDLAMTRVAVNETTTGQIGSGVWYYPDFMTQKEVSRALELAQSEGIVDWGRCGGGDSDDKALCGILPIGKDPLMEQLLKKFGDVVHVSTSFDKIPIARSLPGAIAQSAHVDYFKGTRVVADLTAIFYLNSVSAQYGGASVFENAGIKVQPQKGAMLMWRGTTSSGEPNSHTQHAVEQFLDTSPTSRVILKIGVSLRHDKRMVDSDGCPLEPRAWNRPINFNPLSEYDEQRSVCSGRHVGGTPSTQAPTGLPTEAPIGSPTQAPTPPTFTPSDAPTSAPTSAPTGAPSNTSAATGAPTTEAPTGAPIGVPTVAPTGAPSNATTEAPTAAPTVTLVSVPTLAPTGMPSSAPNNTSNATLMPTSAPTNATSVSISFAVPESANVVSLVLLPSFLMWQM